MSSKYFFKPGDQNYVVNRLREFLYSRFYIKTPANKVCSNTFDSSMQSMLAEYQKFHGLSKQDNVFNAGSILDEATYEKIGAEMSGAEIDLASLYDPFVKKLLYGISWIDLCADWESVAPVISKDKFIGWGHPGVKENCFDYCRAQLQKVGKDMKSTWWGTKDKMNPNIYQIYLTEDVAGMGKGNQVRQFTFGVMYLKKALKEKTPVVAGVDDGEGSPNSDKVTDHFVVIVGMGTDLKGKYFSFYDNATGDKNGGTSVENKLYIYCDDFMLKGTANNEYARGTQYKSYIVTQIRESK
jgi:hypothetical protein